MQSLGKVQIPASAPLISYPYWSAAIPMTPKGEKITSKNAIIQEESLGAVVVINNLTLQGIQNHI